MGFSRQEYWSGVPSPSPACLCSQGHCIPLCSWYLGQGCWAEVGNRSLKFRPHFTCQTCDLPYAASAGGTDHFSHQYEGCLRAVASLPGTFLTPPPPDFPHHPLGFLSVSRGHPAPGQPKPEHKPFFLPDSLLSPSNLSLISFSLVFLSTS